MADARTLDLFIGTLDENWLVSQKEGMEENEEIAKTIATPNGFQYWMEVYYSHVSNCCKLTDVSPVECNSRSH